jgi:FkbM family methyltransferase
MLSLVPKLLLEFERLYNQYTSFPRFRFACSRVIAWGERYLGFATPVLRLDSGVSLEYSSIVAGDVLIRDLLLTGAFEPEQTEVIKGLLPSGGVFIDVGANVGYFSIIGANAVGSSGRVFAFEPMEEIYLLLRKNISLNNISNIETLNLACFSSCGEMTMKRDIDSGKSRLSSLRIDNETVVRLTTLDTFVEQFSPYRIDFIKIDAEGSDLEVLKGAIHTIRKFHPAIMVELGGAPPIHGSISDVFQFFDSLPYRLTQLKGKHSLDLLCEPITKMLR